MNVASTVSFCIVDALFYCLHALLSALVNFFAHAAGYLFL